MSKLNSKKQKKSSFYEGKSFAVSLNQDDCELFKLTVSKARQRERDQNKAKKRIERNSSKSQINKFVLIFDFKSDVGIGWD